MKDRRLLILDLNGTILHRLTRETEFKAFRTHPAVLQAGLKTDMTVNGAKIVIRPHAKHLLGHVLEHFDVAVWTSAQPRNAYPMTFYAFSPLLDVDPIMSLGQHYALTPRDILLGSSERQAESLRDRLLEETKGRARLRFLWTQHECDTESPKKETPTTLFVKPLRKKNLHKVWSAFPRYSSRNTIIIDDTLAKLEAHAENHLQIPEFSVLQHDTDFTLDDHLLTLKAFLDRLIAEDPADVREFLARHQLDDFCASRVMASGTV